MKKRSLTPDQIAARDARRDRFKELCKRVAALTEEERAYMSRKVNAVNTEGHQFSPTNQILIGYQIDSPTICAGFRAWLKAGRVVRKGERGISIWVPTAKKQEAETTEEESGKELYFIGGTVFDISQTVELAASEAAEEAAHTLEAAPAPLQLAA